MNRVEHVIKQYSGAVVGVELLLTNIAVSWRQTPRERRWLLRNALGALCPERRVPLVETLAELGERWNELTEPQQPRTDERDQAAGEAYLALTRVADDAAHAVMASTALTMRRYWAINPPALAYAGGDR